MATDTGIEWTDSTWNPLTGCTKVSQGCKNCYAERLWPKVSGAEAKRTGERPRPFTDVRTHPERLDQPLRWTKPKRIFVNSMSDLFHEDVPDEFIDQAFAVMARVPRHQFQVLTKRPERMVKWSKRAHACVSHALRQTVQEPWVNQEEPFPWPLPNVWLGVSVEDQETADERIPLLLQSPAAVRFLSCEPLLGPIDLTNIAPPKLGDGNEYAGINAVSEHNRRLRGVIDWVIAGGESGPKARPSHPDWFRALRDQCEAAGVPFFFKQWGEWAPAEDVASDYWRGPHQYVNDPALPPAYVIRVGKKYAGRLLDGREHSEYPGKPA